MQASDSWFIRLYAHHACGSIGGWRRAGRASRGRGGRGRGGRVNFPGLQDLCVQQFNTNWHLFACRLLAHCSSLAGDLNFDCHRVALQHGCQPGCASLRIALLTAALYVSRAFTEQCLMCTHAGIFLFPVVHEKACRATWGKDVSCSKAICSRGYSEQWSHLGGPVGSHVC